MPQNAPTTDPIDAATTDVPATADAAASNARDPVEQAPTVIADGIDEFADNLQELVEDPTWSNAVDTFLPVLLEIGRAIFVIVLLLLVVSFAARWAQKGVARALQRTNFDDTLQTFLARVAKYAVWVLAIPVALGVLGIQTTSLAAAIGAAGLAIGLGLQGALGNICAGVLLMMLRPVRIGDYVNIQDEWGTVTDIGLFYTKVNTFQNEVVSIPNQQILSDKVQNLTGNDYRRVDLPVGVAYGTDLRLAERTMLDAVKALDVRYQEQEPAVYLTGFGASSIDFEVHVYCPARSFLTVRHAAIHAINDALAREKIEIPFPQRTLTGRVRFTREDADEA